MLTILTIVFTAAVLVMVASVTKSLEIDGLGSALTLGIAIAVVGWILGYLLGFVMPREGFGPFGSFWGLAAFESVVNTIVLGLASLMAPGVKFKSWGTFLITSLLVNAVVVFGPYVLNQMGLLSGLLGV
jgi:uncharacterized membrane protein YvlD (DUF360 family)